MEVARKNDFLNECNKNSLREQKNEFFTNSRQVSHSSTMAISKSVMAARRKVQDCDKIIVLNTSNMNLGTT